MSARAESVLAYLAEVFARRGAHAYLGERVTMAEHMLQAARLAEGEGADDALVAAALLHDVGHFVGEPDDAGDLADVDRRHEEAGARLLEAAFPARVAACVRLHVAAKRFLCATEPGYLARVSPASLESLARQGGPMTTREAARFRAEAFHADAVRVRRWDEAAKVAGAPTRRFEDYLPLLRGLVTRREFVKISSPYCDEL